jgi:hypothetical protein
MPNQYLEYVQGLATKRQAKPEELAMYHPLSYGRHEINLDGRVFRLDRNDSLDALEKAQVEIAGERFRACKGIITCRMITSAPTPSTAMSSTLCEPTCRPLSRRSDVREG